jgi:hypothetical protein
MGHRCPDAIPDLDGIAMNRDSPVGIDRNGRQRSVRSRTVVLGGAGYPGADQDPCRRTRLLVRAVAPDRMPLKLVEDLRRADGYDVGIAGHRLPAGLKSVAPPKLDRIERERRADLIDHHLERSHSLHGAIAAHRSSGDAARMECIRRDVNFRGVVGAERCSRRGRCHTGRKIGEAAPVQCVVCGESGDSAGRAIDPNPRPNLERVPLYSGLKLVDAIVGKPDGATGKGHRRQSEVQRERRMLAPAKPPPQ